MKKTIKAICVIAAMGTMLVCAYRSGTEQAVTVIGTQTATWAKQAAKDGYIDMDAAVFHDDYIDMREVVGFEASGDGLQLYFEDGSGYWLER